MDIHDPGPAGTDRREWMALLSGADPADLQSVKDQLDLTIDPAFVVKPETGMLMVQAKADGKKARFNLGEVTVSRCILDLDGQVTGYAMILGPDLQHAETAALFDGLMQLPRFRTRLMETLIPVLKEKQRQKENHLARDAAETRVAFYSPAAEE